MPRSTCSSICGFAFALMLLLGLSACGGGGATPAAPGDPLPDPNVIPEAPFDVATTAVSPTTMKVTWTDASSNETGFRLERARRSAQFQFVAVLTAGTESFLDVGLEAEVEYSYRVRAEGSAGSSAWGLNKEPSLGSSASGLTSTPFLLSFKLEAPSTSSSGTYNVTLYPTGAFGVSAAAITEARDPGFTTGVRSWNLEGGPTFTVRIEGNAPGTYYYVGGAPGGAAPAIAVTVLPRGSAQVVLLPLADTSVLHDNEGAFQVANFQYSELMLGNNFFVNTLSSTMLARSLLGFDVSYLVGAGTVERATLRLWPLALAADTSGVYTCAACSAPWDVTQVNGRSVLEFTLTDSVNRAAPTTWSQPWDLDVTGIVRRWVDLSWPNYGFILFEDDDILPSLTTLRMTAFQSLNVNEGEEFYPTLIVQYTPN